MPTIQPKYQPDPESLVDSIAFGPVSKVEAWDKKLQIMKDNTPASCGKARELYKGVASGIQGKRRWKSPSRRMDAAKALMLSDKLQWIPEKCNPKEGKKKKSRTKRHAVKSHKMKRKRKSKSKYTRKMNRKINNRRKTRRRNTRRRNIQMTRKRMMGGDVVSKGVYPSGDFKSRPGKIFLDDDGLKIEHESSGTHTMKKSKITSVTRFWWFGYGNGYKITTDGKGKIPARYWVPCNDDGSIDGLEVATFDALKQLIPQPEPAAEPEPSAAPEPADVEAELAAEAEVGKAAYMKAAANPKFLFSSPAKPTTPHEYMLAIAKQINEDFKRLCDDYKTLKSDLNSILGQFTSVEGQAKSAMEEVSKRRYTEMPARVFNSGFMNKDESNMEKIYAWKRENPEFLGLAPSVNGCDDEESMKMVRDQGKDGTFIDLCMEEIERINKHRFLSPYFGENVKFLHHEYGDFAKVDALTVEDVGLFQDMEFRVVCFDILKELDLGSPTPQKVEDLINRFKTNKVLITEGGNNDKLRKEVLSRFPEMEKLSGYYGDDYRRKGVESEVAEVVNGQEFNKMVTKLSLLNHLNIIVDGEYELLKKNMSELIAKIDEAKIDEAKLAASGSPSSGGF
tara:strand:+ start:927 stop:2789 length:1863 start_codon:yes stop_codon:yes gene_type:complete